jgi:phosphoribosyl 1,2-cyclic phosphodiesterase/ActR/RegA family two-component response regulator
MKTVLLIDDDKVIRMVLAKALAKEGWHVLEAEDGQEGIQRALVDKPDAVVCDLLMPRCNGFQVCRTLRDEGLKLNDLKIIITTSQVFAVDRLHALEAGADEVMIKPVNMAKLIEAISEPRGIAIRSKASKPAAKEVRPAKISPKKNFLRFWGVRGSIPTPGPETSHYGGNTSCVEVRIGGELIILDAGSGLRAMGVQLAKEFGGKALDMTMLLTHTHWDHIQGFPFFAPAYNPNNGLRVLGYEGSRQGLQTCFEVQMENPFFPIGLGQMPGNLRFELQEELELEIGKVSCRAHFANHPGVTVAYRLESGSANLVYMPDHEAYTRMRLHSANAPEAIAEVAGFSQAEEEKLMKFLEGADVLIMDSQYQLKEYESHIGWGHSCFEDTVTTAIRAGIKRLYLFHHDPSHADETVSRMVARSREIVAEHKSDLIVESGREGVICELG